MLYRSAVAGLALFYFIAPVEAKTQNFNLKLLKTLEDTTRTCGQVYQRTAKTTYHVADLELERGDVLNAKKAMRELDSRISQNGTTLPNRIPIFMIGYHRVEDAIRQKAIQESRVSPIDQGEAEFDFLSGILSTLAYHYESGLISPENALEGLLAEYGEEGAKGILRERYRSRVERELTKESINSRNDPREYIFKEFFSLVGSENYHALVRNLDTEADLEDIFYKTALSKLVGSRLEQMDLLWEYKQEWKKLLDESAFGQGHSDTPREIQAMSFLKEALEKARAGQGTLEGNIRANDYFSKMMLALPKGDWKELFDYSAIEFDAKFSYSPYQQRKKQGVIDVPREPWAYLFKKNPFIDVILPEFNLHSDKPMSIRISLYGTLGCASGKELMARAMKQKPELDRMVEAGKGIFKVDMHMVEEAYVAALTESNHKPLISSSGRMYYLKVDRFKLLPVPTKPKKSESHILPDQRPQ